MMMNSSSSSSSSFVEGFANKKILLEKILDESTGQMVLKERVVDEKPAEDDDPEASGQRLTTGQQQQQQSDDQSEKLKSVQECQIAFPHASILSKDEIDALQPVQVNSSIDKAASSTSTTMTTTFYRCPLCPVRTAYYNLLASKCTDHIHSNKHLGMAVRHHQWYVCKCEDASCPSSARPTTEPDVQSMSTCSKHVHFHCPHCARVYTKRNDLKAHLNACCPLLAPTNESALQLTSATLTDKPPPSSQLNVLYLVNQSQQSKPAALKRPLNVDQPSAAPPPPATKIIKLVSASELLGRPATADQPDGGNLSLVDFQQLQQSLGIDSSSEPNQMAASTHQIVNLASSNHHLAGAAGKSHDASAFKSSAAKAFSMAQHNYNQSSGHHSSDFSSPPHLKSSSSLYNSGLPAHIVQNYSILANEIIAPLDTVAGTAYDDIDYSSVLKQWTNAANQAVAAAASASQSPSKPRRTTTCPSSSQVRAGQEPASGGGVKSQRDTATCQFCGRFMLKKNIPTHIRRAHTPKEELVCLNEEQCIFTLQHLKPGQRRKRSARAYDYSLMTAKVSSGGGGGGDDPCDSIENKFIMFGEEILNTDLVQLADRIKYGVSQIPASTLAALVDVLTKIESSNVNQEDICDKAKELKNQICFFLASGEEFKYKLRQVGDEITSKKSQVNALRAELKEIMSKKTQLERRIQPLVCDLQRLEDHHGSLVESIYQPSAAADVFDYSSLTNSSSSNNASSSKYDDDDDDDDGDEVDRQEETTNDDDDEDEDEN